MRVHRCECGCGEFILEDESHHYRAFLNNAHRQKAYRDRKRVEKNASKIVGTKQNCMNCGIEFIARTPRHIFHCTSCRASYWQKMKRWERLGF